MDGFVIEVRKKRIDLDALQVAFKCMSSRLKTIGLAQERILHRHKLLKCIVALFLTLAHHQKQWQPSHTWVISHTAL